MNSWVQIFLILRNLGFNSLLGSGVLVAAYWLGFLDSRMELNTYDLLLVGAVIGLGIDLLFRNTVPGQFLTYLISTSIITILYFPLKLVQGSQTANDIRVRAIRRIDHNYLPNSSAQTSDDDIELREFEALKDEVANLYELAINNLVDVGEVETLRQDVDYLLNEITTFEAKMNALTGTATASERDGQNFE